MPNEKSENIDCHTMFALHFVFVFDVSEAESIFVNRLKRCTKVDDCNREIWMKARGKMAMHQFVLQGFLKQVAYHLDLVGVVGLCQSGASCAVSCGRFISRLQCSSMFCPDRSS